MEFWGASPSADVESVEDEPWYSCFELLLHRYEVGEDAETGRRGGEDDEDPEVQLEFGPAVATPCLAVDDFCGHCGMS